MLWYVCLTWAALCWFNFMDTPGYSLVGYNNHGNRYWALYPIMSVMACIVSLCFWSLYSHNLVRIEDWPAFIDTTGAVVFAAVSLLVVTIIPNVTTLLAYLGKIQE